MTGAEFVPRHTYAPDSMAALCGAVLADAGPWLIGTGEPSCAGCLLIVNACRCFSCDGQCGGSRLAGSCGPVADVDGRLICEACREAADVIDTERAGAKVTIAQGCVRLRADVWNPAASSLWLDARGARHLAELLHRRAAELDLAEAAEVGEDDPPGVPAYAVIPRRPWTSADQAAENAKHAGEAWPPGNGDPGSAR